MGNSDENKRLDAVRFTKNRILKDFYFVGIFEELETTITAFPFIFVSIELFLEIFKYFSVEIF